MYSRTSGRPIKIFKQRSTDNYFIDKEFSVYCKPPYLSIIESNGFNTFYCCCYYYNIVFLMNLKPRPLSRCLSHTLLFILYRYIYEHNVLLNYYYYYRIESTTDTSRYFINTQLLYIIFYERTHIYIILIIDYT